MRTYTITLKKDGIPVDVNLRITLKAQYAMRNKYNENAIATIFSGLDNIEKLIYVLNLALNYKDNDNTITDAEELYELIAENDLGGISGFEKILMGIARESGIINEEDKEKFEKMGEAMFDDEKNFELLSASKK